MLQINSAVTFHKKKQKKRSNIYILYYVNYFRNYFATVKVLINARIKCALNSENGHLRVN